MSLLKEAEDSCQEKRVQTIVATSRKESQEPQKEMAVKPDSCKSNHDFAIVCETM